MGKHLKEGQIFKINLKDKYHIYGRVIAKKYFAFYDAKTKIDLSIDEIIKKPILFILCVYLEPVKNGEWPIIGFLPLESKLKILPDFFIQDEMNLKDIKIYNSTKIPIDRIAKYEECLHLERMAVWSKHHVEKRIEDYYSKRKNITVEHLKIKKPK